MTDPASDPITALSKKYLWGIFAFLFLFAFVVYGLIANRNETTIKNELTLKADPTFRSEHRGKGGTSYWIDLEFTESDKTLKIWGDDYQFLDTRRFKQDIKTGAIVTVEYVDEHIVQLAYGGRRYMDPAGVAEGGHMWLLYVAFATGTVFVTTLITYLLRKTIPQHLFLELTKRFLFVLIIIAGIVVLILRTYLPPMPAPYWPGI